MSTYTNKKSVDMLGTLMRSVQTYNCKDVARPGDLSVPQTDQGGSDKNDRVV